MAIENNPIILQKLQALSNYLENYTTWELKEGKCISKEGINEDEFQDIDINEDIDVKALLAALYDKMNLDSDEKVSTKELSCFKDVFEAAGLTFEDVLNAFKTQGEGLYGVDSKNSEDSAQDTDFEEEEDDTSSEKMSFSDFKKEMSKNEKMDDLIAEFGYKEVFDLLDANGDNKISQKEIKKVSKSSDTLGELTYGEMKKFLDETKETEDEDFQSLKEKLKKALGLDLPEITATENNPLSNVVTNAVPQNPIYSAPVSYSTGANYSAPQVSGAGSGGGSQNYTSSNNVSIPSINTTKEDTVTLKELEDELQAREKTHTEAKEALSKVYDEIDADIKEAKEDMEGKEELYNKALEKDADSNPELKKLKDDKDENDKSLKENEKNIKEKESEINDKEQEIKAQDIVVKNLESEVKSLKGSLDSLMAIKQTDENKKELTSKIESVEKQYSAKNEELEKAKEKQTLFEGEKEDLDDELEKYNEENKTLITTRDDLEEKIEDTADTATKNALKAFQEARKTYETTKKDRLNTEKTKVDEAQKLVEEQNQKITEFKNKEQEKENSINTDAQKFLSELEATGGDAWNQFDTLCNTLGKNREETMAYLSELCYSENWGNGCIDPVTLCAQIRQESGYNATIVGDGGLALGLGQFHDCAVEEVNNQYGTNYTSSDRANPNKALEMMVLLLKYDYSRTGNKDAMLAMYNQGNANGINTAGGQNYVRHVYQRINR